MGYVYEIITLKNSNDVGNFQQGFIKESEIRKTSVKALVDTGARTLVINNEVLSTLGLAIIGKRGSELADGSWQDFQITAPVDILWEDRETSCRAIVAPDSSEVLLGAIPLEDMDLIVDPFQQKLIGAHGYEAIIRI